MSDTGGTPNSYLITIIPIYEKGMQGEDQPVAHVRVEEGRLKVITAHEVEGVCAPLARTINRKLAPKSGNQLFVS